MLNNSSLDARKGRMDRRSSHVYRLESFSHQHVPSTILDSAMAMGREVEKFCEGVPQHSTAFGSRVSGSKLSQVYQPHIGRKKIGTH